MPFISGAFLSIFPTFISLLNFFPLLSYSNVKLPFSENIYLLFPSLFIILVSLPIFNVTSTSLLVISVSEYVSVIGLFFIYSSIFLSIILDLMKIRVID